MDNLTLKATGRTLQGKKIKQLRKQNKLPSIIYGHGVKAQPLEVEYLVFKKIYEEAGESTLINLQIDNKKPVKVIIQDVQSDPVSDKFLHVDFHQIKMAEKMTAEIPIKFVGEAPAVKEQGGIMVKNLDKIKIECLPEDLVHEIEVDISQLKELESAIHVQELNIPKGITVLNKPEETITLVEPPRTEEELKELEEKPEEEAAALEGEEKKGEEGEESGEKEKVDEKTLSEDKPKEK